MSWYEDAACLGYPFETFFPTIINDEGGEEIDDGTIWESYGDTSHFYDEAREICMSCPVREQCLAMALANKERYGMLGGLTPIERRRIERKDRRARLRERRAKEL
jgi:Transcription factor WhiB